MPAQLHVWNGERAHVGRWREMDGVAVIAPPPGGALPSVAFIEHCCALLSVQGYSHVVTPALTPTEILPFLQAGFRSREQLYVLVHHLGDPVPVRTVPGVVLRRGRNGDVPGALGIDRDAFDDFWRFDGEALADACKATPQFRFRVAVNQAPLRPKHARAETGGVVPAGTLLGYCITGRSRSQGFLQRLAVAPAAWGQGIGRTLVFDALHWLLHRHARSCIVNTQESNGRAATLYKTCGFEMSPTGLYVLTRPLGSDVMA